MKLDVLYEDNHLLVVCKPPAMATQGVARDRQSLVTAARQYLKQKFHKPGNVYVGVVSRLDSPVSGVVVLARTSKAAGRLSEQFRLHTVRKHYWAVVEGNPPARVTDCLDWVRHDDRGHRMQIASSGAAGAQEARLRCRRLRSLSGLALVEVELVTGRKHQIRLQMAERGWPIVGDAKYGSRRRFAPGIALHARRLVFVHPVKGDVLDLTAALPRSWAVFGLSDFTEKGTGSPELA